MDGKTSGEHRRVNRSVSWQRGTPGEAIATNFSPLNGMSRGGDPSRRSHRTSGTQESARTSSTGRVNNHYWRTPAHKHPSESSSAPNTDAPSVGIPGPFMKLPKSLAAKAHDANGSLIPVVPNLSRYQLYHWKHSDLSNETFHPAPDMIYLNTYTPQAKKRGFEISYPEIKQTRTEVKHNRGKWNKERKSTVTKMPFLKFRETTTVSNVDIHESCAKDFSNKSSCLIRKGNCGQEPASARETVLLFSDPKESIPSSTSSVKRSHQERDRVSKQSRPIRQENVRYRPFSGTTVRTPDLQLAFQSSSKGTIRDYTSANVYKEYLETKTQAEKQQLLAPSSIVRALGKTVKHLPETQVSSPQERELLDTTPLLAVTKYNCPTTMQVKSYGQNDAALLAVMSCNLPYTPRSGDNAEYKSNASRSPTNNTMDTVPHLSNTNTITVSTEMSSCQNAEKAVYIPY